MIAPLSHRRHAIPVGREAEVSRTAGWISPVLLVDGRVAGVWEPGPTPTVQPFAPLPPDTAREVDHLLASHGTWGPPG